MSKERLPTPKRGRGDMLCPHHRGKEVMFICKDFHCNGELICTKCMTTTHKGHKHTALDELIAMRTSKKISHFIEHAEKVEQSKLKGQMRYAEEKIDEKRRLFPTVIHKVRHHGEKMKMEIEQITNSFIRMCEKLETETLNSIHHYKKQIIKMYADINSLVYECKKVLRTGSYVQMYDVERETNIAVQLPQFPLLRYPEFEALEAPTELLEHSFGTMFVKTDYGPNPPKPPSAAASDLTTMSDNTAVTNEEPEPDLQSIRSHLLEEVDVVTEFNYPYEISKVCPISDHAWLSYWDRKEILLMNQKGDIKQTYKVDFEVWDICVSRITNNLWMCCREDCSIQELTTTLAKAPRVRFRTNREPWCLAVTDDNKVVVGMTKQLSQYSLEGRVLNLTTIDKDGQMIITSPRCITECPITRNIAVADFDMVSDDGEGKPRVVVLDHLLQHIFSYRKKTTKLPADSILEPSRFNPWGLCYDSFGDLVIADFNNDCILLISGEGEFLKTLQMDYYSSPISLGLQSDGLLWVIFNYHDVKVLKYQE